MLSQILTGQMSAEALVGLAIALVLGITVHEFSHALAATWLGDSLPRRQGRLTLAPLAHLDLVGSLMFVIGGFGWGKPVQYNPYDLRAGPRTGPALVAVAGPISNFLFALLLAIPTRLVALWAESGSIFAAQPPQAATILVNLLLYVVYYNLMLGLFNLIPVFPLDGFSVLQGLLPPSMADQYEQTKQWGILVLFVLIFLGGRILDPILYTPVATLTHLLTGV